VTEGAARSPAEPRRAYLDEILARKRVEVGRRLVHRGVLDRLAAELPLDPARGARALTALRRTQPHHAPRIIAEIKFRSPSVGAIRPPAPGAAASLARSYQRGGAAALSVLADGPGFGGSPLTVRRVTQACETPVLFKEFVLDPVQVELARVCGASMVLLLVRALPLGPLQALCDQVRRAGMEPVVEAADEAELEVALRTDATLVGVNARDLRTFEVDMERAARCLAQVDAARIAIFMSGIRTPADFARLGGTRADAALIGEGLMRCEDPAEGVRAMLAAATLEETT
jgi:indole-3-glycerol phosphate synthase